MSNKSAVAVAAAAASIGVLAYYYLRKRLHPSLLELDDIIDPHHHYFDYKNNTFHEFLQANAMPKCLHLPSKYVEDAGSLPIVASVHVEAIPDTGLEEATWVNKLADEHGDKACAAIVASWNPASKDATALDAIVAAAPHRVRGIRTSATASIPPATFYQPLCYSFANARGALVLSPSLAGWICNYDGPLQPGESYVASRATWPRVDHDFFAEGTPAAIAFEEGLQILAARGLSFDLQCNPSQLVPAAKMLARLPSLRVVLDHIGTPRGLKCDDSAADAAMLATWREGMRALSELPNVYVKLSMLNYAVPGCFDEGNALLEAFAKTLVREVIELFGARRCMFNSNWPVDGPEHGGPTMEVLYSKHFAPWAADYSLAERKRLFAGTAREFYKLTS